VQPVSSRPAPTAAQPPTAARPAPPTCSGPGQTSSEPWRSPGGFKNDREGLNALRDCLDREAARVVFFFATNRLFRKTYRSLAFVEEQVVDRGLRAVFVRSGVDRTPGGGGTC